MALLSSALVKSGYEVYRFNAFARHPNAQNTSGLSRTIFKFSRKPFFEDFFYDSEIIYHALRMHRLAMKKEIDLLHFHYLSFFPSSWFLRQIDKIPVVVTLHWCPMDYPPELASKLWHSRIFPAHQYLSFAFGVKNASRVISPSKYYADLVERRCGIRSTVIPNPICVEKFAKLPQRETARKQLLLNPEDFVILCVGRLETEKGLEYLIQAFKSVISRHPCAKLIVVGDGSLKGSLIDMVDRTRLTNVVFAGRVPDRYLNLLLSAADLYVSPSLYENFSISILDALASGLPIVCTNVGGSPEIVEDNTNGLVVPPRDSAALSEAILKMISDELGCKRFRENNKAKAQLYSEVVIFPRIMEIYNELLSSS